MDGSTIHQTVINEAIQPHDLMYFFVNLVGLGNTQTSVTLFPVIYQLSCVRCGTISWSRSELWAYGFKPVKTPFKVLIAGVSLRSGLSHSVGNRSGKGCTAMTFLLFIAATWPHWSQTGCSGTQYTLSHSPPFCWIIIPLRGLCYQLSKWLFWLGLHDGMLLFHAPHLIVLRKTIIKK